MSKNSRRVDYNTALNTINKQVTAKKNHIKCLNIYQLDIIEKRSKERLQKKPAKGIKIFQKKQKTKSENTVGNDISIS